MLCRACLWQPHLHRLERVVTVFDMAMHANVAEQSASCHVSCHQHSKAVCVVNSTQMYCDENIRQNNFQQTAVRTF